MTADIRIIKALEVPEGDSVTVKRLMPVHGMRNFDPFVLWDHFDISGHNCPVKTQINSTGYAYHIPILYFPDL